jgi:hypothetical protein
MCDGVWIGVVGVEADGKLTMTFGTNERRKKGLWNGIVSCEGVHEAYAWLRIPWRLGDPSNFMWHLRRRKGSRCDPHLN